MKRQSDLSRLTSGGWRADPETLRRAGRPTSSDISEALWETQREYGIELEVGEQAALARWLEHKAAVRNPRRRFITALDVREGMERLNRTIPRGFASTVEKRLRRLAALA